MSTAQLGAMFIGKSGDINVFRVDLGQSGLNAVSSITFKDDGKISGASGGFSGFDFDFVLISSTATTSATTVLGLAGEPVFDFSGAGVSFRPGFMQPWRNGQDPDWNTPNLFGTTGANIYSPEASTLGVAGDERALSLGESGEITLLLKQALATGGRYLYFGEAWTLDQGVVTVSDQDAPPHTPPQGRFTLYGTRWNDTIVLGSGANAQFALRDCTVFGLAGADTIVGAFGNDDLYGSAGNDRLVGRGGNDRLWGSSGNDTATGGAGNDWLYGQAGADVLAGGAGADWISGGAGKDRLSGGPGKDKFVFNTRGNVDRIYDFNARDDTFYLDNAVFKKAGKGTPAAPVKLKIASFFTGEAAHDTNDRIIYNRETGALSYDPDGIGAAPQIQFAQIGRNLKLTYHDFFTF
jgi:Ca2+-binding RTX toxin-like protein